MAFVSNASAARLTRVSCAPSSCCLKEQQCIRLSGFIGARSKTKRQRFDAAAEAVCLRGADLLLNQTVVLSTEQRVCPDEVMDGEQRRH